VTNPYNSCVANREILGSKCAILWHVDYLKISQVKSKVIDIIVYLIEE